MYKYNKNLETLRTYKDVLYDYLYENNLGNTLKKIGQVFLANGDPQSSKIKITLNKRFILLAEQMASMKYKIIFGKNNQVLQSLQLQVNFEFRNTQNRKKV